MNDEIKQAFEHPSARSRASEPDAMLDRISLRDHIVSVEIGAFQAERDMTQRLSFNVVVEVRHVTEDLGDDVDLILSYDSVTEAINIELAAERLNLLETLAERIADRILREPQAQRVFLRIEKLDRGGGALGVEIVRQLSDVAQSTIPDNAPDPARIVHLSAVALESVHLGHWVDQLSAMDAPLIFTVAGDDKITDVGAETAQAHVDLLAIEQKAWAFAAQEPRCAVVETRTELDWAMKNDQTCVWAPRKFVMDAVESPISLINSPIVLADWLATQIGALEVLVIGEDLPNGMKTACRSIPVGRIDISAA